MTLLLGIKDVWEQEEREFKHVMIVRLQETRLKLTQIKGRDILFL